MTKKLSAVSLLLILCLTVFCPVTVLAEGEPPRAIDLSDTWSAEELTALESTADYLSDKTGMDFVLLMIDDAEGKTSMEYADDYYDYNGYAEDGTLFLIDLDNRNVWISTKGLAIRYYTDERIEELLDAAFLYMPDGDYFNAMLAMLDEAESIYERGIPDDQYNEEDRSCVIDLSGTWSDEEIAELSEKASFLTAKTKMDFVLLMIDDAEGKTSMEYADDYYDYNGYAEDGALFLIDLDNRNVWISTKGLAIRYYTDSRIEELLDAAFLYMPDGDYFNAMLAMLDEAESIYERGIPDGQYNEDIESGDISKYRSLEGSEIMIALVIALLAGGIPALVIANSYKMKGGKYAYPLHDYGKVHLYENESTLVNKFVTSRRIETSSSSSGSGSSSSGRSSTHHSSSGSSHGGGGRSF